MVELSAGMKISRILACTTKNLRRGLAGTAAEWRHWREEEDREDEKQMEGELERGSLEREAIGDIEGGKME